MKKTLILFFIFLILVVFVYFYEYKGGQEREKVEELKASLLKIENEKIESVTLIRSEQDTISYVRSDENNWQIIVPVLTEAEKSTVSGNISAFTNAKIKRRLLTSSDKLRNFGLSPPIAEVIIKSRENRTIHLFIGDEAATRGDLFVFFPGDLTSEQKDSIEVLVTTTNIHNQTQKSLFDLRDKKIIHFDENQVRKMELISSEGEIILEKSGNNWEMVKPQGVPLDDSRVTSFFSSIKNYTAIEFVQEHLEDKEVFGFFEPDVKLTLSLGEERSIKEIIIGDKKEGEESFYGYESGRSSVFLIRESTKSGLAKSPFYYQDKKLLKFEDDEVTDIRFEGTYQLTLSKKDTLGWYAFSDSSVEVSGSQMDQLFSRLRGLNARELVTYKPENLDEFGLSKGVSQIPFLEALIVKDDMEIGGIAVGDTVGNDRYIKNEEFPSVYLISTSQVNRLTDWLDEVIEMER